MLLHLDQIGSKCLSLLVPILLKTIGYSLMLRKVFSSQLRINMISGSIVTVIDACIMLAAYRIYLHFLGYEKYGVWLVLTTVLTFIQLGELGIGQAVMKLVAEERGRNNIEGIQSYIVSGLLLLFVSGTVILVLLLAFQSHIISAFRLNHENAELVAWLLPYIGILSIYAFLAQMFKATLSGLGRMDLANIIQCCGHIVCILIACMLLYFGRGIESLLLGSICLNIVVNVASIKYIRNIADIPLIKFNKLDLIHSKRIISFGGAVFVNSIISMLFSPFNKLMLSRYVSVAAIPIYEIAYNGSMQARALIEAAFRALMPEVSRLSGEMTQYSKKIISKVYYNAMKLIFAFGIPLFAGMAIFAPFILKTWLGNSFVENMPPIFRVMLIGSFLTLIGIPAYYTTIGFGKIRHIILINIMSAGGNAVLMISYHAIIGNISIMVTACCFVASGIIPLIYFLYITRRLIDKNDANHTAELRAVPSSNIEK
jgi:O-antigen/teichoic acid export membrane protein